MRTPIGDLDEGAIPSIGRRETLVNKTRLTIVTGAHTQGRESITRHTFELTAPHGKAETHFEWFDYAEPWDVRVDVSDPSLAVAAYEAVLAIFPDRPLNGPGAVRGLAQAFLAANAPELARHLLEPAIAAEEPESRSRAMLEKLVVACGEPAPPATPTKPSPAAASKANSAKATSKPAKKKANPGILPPLDPDLAERIAAARWAEFPNDATLSAETDAMLPSEVAGSVAAIVAMYKPMKAMIVAHGFDVTRAGASVAALEAQDSTFKTYTFPPRIGDPDRVQTIIDDMREQWQTFRQCAHQVFRAPELAAPYDTYTARDGTPHIGLAHLDRRRVCQLALQDSNEFIADELPLIDECINCRVLHLFGAQLRPHEFRAIDFTRLTELRSLDISDNVFSESDLDLSACTELHALALRRTRALPGGLSTLKKLRYLDLRSAPALEANVEELRRTLPGCTVQIR